MDEIKLLSDKIISINMEIIYLKDSFEYMMKILNKEFLNYRDELNKLEKDNNVEVTFFQDGYIIQTRDIRENI